jgi:hypothetical protein
MPRYFFHLLNGGSSCDEEGAELPDLDAAEQRAIEAAREMMGEDIKHGRLHLGHRIEIKDADGRESRTVHFKDAVSIEW